MGQGNIGFVLCCVAIISCAGASGFGDEDVSTLPYAARPLVPRPKGTTYKTLLNIDSGGVRSIISAMIMVEVEQSIKRYLLKNPDLLPPEVNATTVDDFEISLADYFDCMTGTSGGSWVLMYIAKRDGHKAFRDFLERPDVVLRYGEVPFRSAKAITVFIKEFSGMIYPNELLNLSAGVPFDLSNPEAPGVSAPLYDIGGMEFAFEALFGNSTLADLDTSTLAPTQDLITGYAVFFIQNAFKDPPVSSSAVLHPRSSPRQPPGKDGRFNPDFEFREGRNYFLKDVVTAASTPPIWSNAKSISQIHNDTEEYLAIDGIGVVESSALPGSFFAASESGLHSFNRLAIFSVGTGFFEINFSTFRDAGALRWYQNFNLLFLYLGVGQESHNALLDYIYYSNPDTRPYQFLRIQCTESTASEEEGVALNFNLPQLADMFERLGEKNAKKHRDSIDAFVHDFIFG